MARIDTSGESGRSALLPLAVWAWLGAAGGFGCTPPEPPCEGHFVDGLPPSGLDFVHRAQGALPAEHRRGGR